MFLHTWLDRSTIFLRFFRHHCASRKFSCGKCVLFMLPLNSTAFSNLKRRKKKWKQHVWQRMSRCKSVAHCCPLHELQERGITRRHRAFRSKLWKVKRGRLKSGVQMKEGLGRLWPDTSSVVGQHTDWRGRRSTHSNSSLLRFQMLLQ